MKLLSSLRSKAAPVAAILALGLSLGLTACGSQQAASTNSTAALAGADITNTSKYTTDSVTPLDQIDTSKLGLGTNGTIRVGTLSDAPPNIFIKDGVFTGFDNELLKAMANKLKLKVEFVSTDFAALLSQVASKQFDVGSSSISTTDKRRQTVGFTNGYDYGYMALVAKKDSGIKGFKDITKDMRIGVVQGTVQDDYVSTALGIQPVRFPDYVTAYNNVKNGQVDAWVAPSQQASGQVKPGDPAAIVEKTINTENFTAFAVNKDNKPLIDALNSALDAVIADGTWAKLAKQWYPDRTTPDNWKPGSKASDFKRS